MINTLLDRTTNIFDSNFLQLRIDSSNLEKLKNDTFKNSLFYESLKQKTIDNQCYLYLLITSNYYSKYNFISYQGTKNLEDLLFEYMNYKFNNSNKYGNSISNLDKLLLQIGSPNYKNSMEVDHIFPTNGVKISKQIDQYLNVNHIGNLCYISKTNNLKKSNILPLNYIQNLLSNNEAELYNEFITQTYWKDLISEKFNGEIKNKADFDSFLLNRGKKLVQSLVANIEGRLYE